MTPGTPVTPADEVTATTPRLEFAFGVALTLDPPLLLGGPPAGQTAVVHVTGGSFAGPRLRGRVVPGSGGDWARLRADGVLEFDARYLLEEADGTLITLRSLGYRWGPPSVMERLVRGQQVEPSAYYMRVTPRFEVRPGAHDWLGRHVFVGVGRKTPGGNHIDYFAVT